VDDGTTGVFPALMYWRCLAVLATRVDADFSGAPAVDAGRDSSDDINACAATVADVEYVTAQ